MPPTERNDIMENDSDSDVSNSSNKRSVTIE